MIISSAVIMSAQELNIYSLLCSVPVSDASFEHSIVQLKYCEQSLLKNTNDYTDSEGLGATHFVLPPTDRRLMKAK